MLKGVKVSHNTMLKIQEIKAYWKRQFGLTISSKSIVDALFERGEPDTVFGTYTPDGFGKEKAAHVIKIGMDTYDIIEKYRRQVQERTNVDIYNKNIVDEMFRYRRPETVFKMDAQASSNSASII